MELWTAKQAAEYWGVSESRARARLRDRGIRSGYPADLIRAVSSQQGQRTDLADVDDAIRREFESPRDRPDSGDLRAAVERLLNRYDITDDLPIARTIPPDTRSTLIVGVNGSGKTEAVRTFLRAHPTAEVTVLTRTPAEHVDLLRVRALDDIHAFLSIIGRHPRPTREAGEDATSRVDHIFVVDDYCPQSDTEKRWMLDELKRVSDGTDSTTAVILTATSAADLEPADFAALVALQCSDYLWLTGPDPARQNVAVAMLGVPARLVEQEQQVIDEFAPNSPERRRLVRGAAPRPRPRLPGTGIIRLPDGDVHPLRRS